MYNNVRDIVRVSVNSRFVSTRLHFIACFMEVPSSDFHHQPRCIWRYSEQTTLVANWRGPVVVDKFCNWCPNMALSQRQLDSWLWMKKIPLWRRLLLFPSRHTGSEDQTQKARSGAASEAQILNDYVIFDAKIVRVFWKKTSRSTSSPPGFATFFHFGSLFAIHSCIHLATVKTNHWWLSFCCDESVPAGTFRQTVFSSFRPKRCIDMLVPSILYSVTTPYTLIMCMLSFDYFIGSRNSVLSKFMVCIIVHITVYYIYLPGSVSIMVLLYDCSALSELLAVHSHWLLGVALHCRVAPLGAAAPQRNSLHPVQTNLRTFGLQTSPFSVPSILVHVNLLWYWAACICTCAVFRFLLLQ